MRTEIQGQHFAPDIRMSSVLEGGYEGYGKLLPRVQNTFAGSRLTLVGGEFDGKSPRLLDPKKYLPPYPVDRSDPYAVAAFNVGLTNAVHGLLGMGDESTFARRYMDEIGGEDIRTVYDTSVQAAKGENPAMAVRVVFGATPSMPLRGLSYLVPGLVYVENIKQKTGIEPQLQIVFATNTSSQFSNVPREAARAEARNFAEVAYNFTATFFPKLQENVVYLEDREETPARAEALGQAVLDNASEELMQQLSAKGERRGVNGTHGIYAAAHLLMHDTAANDVTQPLFADQSDVIIPTVVASIGGKEEKRFYRLRHQVKPAMGDTFTGVQTMQLITAHHVPPYYMDKDGDVGLREAMAMTPDELAAALDRIAAKPTEETPVGRAARFDINYLRKVTEENGGLVAFLQRRKS